MYEYKVVPAPSRAVKAKGLKTTADRFAHALTECLNAEAAGGWQYLRTETLPCEERSTFGSVKQSQQVVMIFARTLPGSPQAVVRLDEAAAPEAPRPALRLPATPERAEVAAKPMAEPVPAPVPAPEPRPVLRPDPRPELRADPPAAEPEAQGKRRQEPLFRSGAMLRAENGNRAEPVLRPKAGDAES